MFLLSKLFIFFNVQLITIFTPIYKVIKNELVPMRDGRGHIPTA